jgi:NADH:ubiquinone oxidoreductase subunit 2 (subunit N)
VFFTFTTSLFIVALFAALHSFISTSNSQENIPEVPVLTFLVACFGLILLEVTDFGLFIVCLEGFSLTLYILASSGRTYGGVSASIKYFVFGTLGSILLY